MKPTLAATLAILVTALDAPAVVLFHDDFSDGAVGAAVSINAPDPRDSGGPITPADNTSVSGTIITTLDPDQVIYAGDNAGPGTLGGEAGGSASWQRGGTGTASGTVSINYDFATNAALVANRQFTIDLSGLDPVDTVSGTSGNWAAVSLFRTALPGDGTGTDVNDTNAGLGVLLRDNGDFQLFSLGTNFLGDTTYDSTPGGTCDISIVISNISGFGPGNSFDYELWVDGSSFYSGTRTGIDTSHNFISLETRTDSSTIGALSVSTIPEPATLAGLVLGLAALTRRRR